MSGPLLSEKTLDILEAVAALHSASMPQIQEQCGLPMTTTHRIIQSLLRRGFVMKVGRGSYRLGTSVVAISAGLSIRDLLTAGARAHVNSLSRRARSHVHLGIWEDGMVTYLIKQRHGRARLHSAEGMQLEAYCSAIGKVLLSGLTQDELKRYVAEGDFVPLTPHTLTNPDRVTSEIETVRARGWASDNEETTIGLRCAAVPVHDRTRTIIAALSVSTVSTANNGTDPQIFLPWLRGTADAISRHLFPAAQI